MSDWLIPHRATHIPRAALWLNAVRISDFQQHCTSRHILWHVTRTPRPTPAAQPHYHLQYHRHYPCLQRCSSSLYAPTRSSVRVQWRKSASASHVPTLSVSVGRPFRRVGEIAVNPNMSTRSRHVFDITTYAYSSTPSSCSERIQ